MVQTRQIKLYLENFISNKISEVFLVVGCQSYNSDLVMRDIGDNNNYQDTHTHAGACQKPVELILTGTFPVCHVFLPPHVPDIFLPTGDMMGATEH